MNIFALKTDRLNPFIEIRFVSDFICLCQCLLHFTFLHEFKKKVLPKLYFHQNFRILVFIALLYGEIVVVSNVKMKMGYGKNEAGHGSRNTAKAWITGKQGTGRIDLRIYVRYGKNCDSSMFT